MEKFTVEKDWVTESGFRAVCIAIPDMHRCGYVGLPKEHVLHGIDYIQSTEKLAEAWKKVMNSEDGENKRGPIITLMACGAGKDSPDNWSPDRIINVHGGLTFASGTADYPVKHDGLWWFGFDCGHYGDGRFKSNFGCGGPVRSVEYVKEECESMASQLKILS